MSKLRTLPESIIRMVVIVFGLLVTLAGVIGYAVSRLSETVNIDGLSTALILFIGATIICAGVRIPLP